MTHKIRSNFLDISTVTSMKSTTIEDVTKVMAEVEIMAKDASINTEELMQRLEDQIKLKVLLR